MDGATESSALLDSRSPEAARVRWGGEPLPPHGRGSLYEAFPPEQARRLASRRALPQPPTQGRGLHSAAIERRVLTMQCLARRIPEMETRTKEPPQGEQRRNVSQKGVAWPFSTRHARITLTRLYPQMQS